MVAPLGSQVHNFGDGAGVVVVRCASTAAGDGTMAHGGVHSSALAPPLAQHGTRWGPRRDEASKKNSGGVEKNATAT